MKDIKREARKQLEREDVEEAGRSAIRKAQEIAGDVKERYDSLSPRTKRRLAAGVAGLGAVLAAGAVIQKRKKKRKKIR